MNRKVLLLIITFLLLIPFRLPIGVAFIMLTTTIAELAGSISDKILAANVVVTKLIYNMILSSISVYNIEMLSISVKGRRAQEGIVSPSDTIYWWTIVIGIILASYIIFDVLTTYDLFYELYK